MNSLRKTGFLLLCLLFLPIFNYYLHSQSNTMTSSMTTARAWHAATLLSNGELLITGGTNGPNPSGLVATANYLSSAELYNPSTGTFSPTGSLSVGRAQHKTTLMPNGMVLIWGGITSSSAPENSTTAEVYNPTAGTFSVINNMPAGFILSATSLTNGQVLLMFENSAAGAYISFAYLYNPATSTFTNTGASVPFISQAAALLPDGTVLLATGASGTKGSGRGTTTTYASNAEIFNPSTLTFSSTGAQVYPGGGATLSLPNGNVLITGGLDSTTQQTYNFASQTFTSGPAMSIPWALLNDGNIVSDPEVDLSNNTDVIRLYNASTASASNVGYTLVFRNQIETVTPLPTGGVLFAGGEDENGNALSSAEIYEDPGVTGIIHPKYIIVGLTYAPPGPSSYVQYTDSTTIGTTNTITQTLNTNESLMVSIGTSAGIPGWLNGSITGTSTSSFTQQNSTSNTVTVSDQASLAFKTPGTANAFSPVNHDYDIIWLWLNPIMQLTVNPNNPNALTWNGYGFDEADQPALDIWPVYVGYLNGDFGPLDPEDAQVLARSWATGQTFPQSGAGPALTSADFTQILQADPFTNTSYTVTPSGTDPSTTADGRFTISGGPSGQAQSFPYKQALPGDSPISETYSNMYTNTTMVGKTAQNSYEQSFSLDEKFSTGIFFDSLTIDIKETGSLTLTNQTLSTITNTAVQTDSLYIQGPPACTGSPCLPQYVSPAEFDVYQDNLYGTFMFNPVN